MQDADLQRVPERAADIGVSEQPVEVGEADPGAGKAEKGRIVLKGDDVAEKRQIAEENEVNKTRQDKEVHPSLAPDAR
ncbi:MAG: hypothetical protein LC793_11025 [Thermomicrobia bacterium]|nr:hypothetical protein [Thermomicrobia bacterium]